MAKDRHRKGYYREYNLAHPERLRRIGIYITEDSCYTQDEGMPNVTLSDDIDDDDLDMRCTDYFEN